jgi:O-antigen ligase
MSLIKKILDGGMLAGKKTYVISGIGILSAFGTYLAGDCNLFEMLNAAFPLAAICFLRKGLNDGK